MIVRNELATPVHFLSYIIQIGMTAAYHIGCWCVGGKRGNDWGQQFAALMMRSARRKLRNKLATRRSCRNNRWNNSTSSRATKTDTRKCTYHHSCTHVFQLHRQSEHISDVKYLHREQKCNQNFNLVLQSDDILQNDMNSSPRGSTFHAIVSVIAVNIQLSSPNGVFRSFWRPGILSIRSGSKASNERGQNLETKKQKKTIRLTSLQISSIEWTTICIVPRKKSFFKLTSRFLWQGNQLQWAWSFSFFNLKLMHRATSASVNL